MLFNFGKCKCLHTEPGNTGMNYEMGGNILSKTVEEKDLGAGRFFGISDKSGKIFFSEFYQIIPCTMFADN